MQHFYRKSLLFMLLFASNYCHSQTFMEMFDSEGIKQFDLYGGLNASNVKSKTLNQYIESYNQANKAILSEEFNPFKSMMGYEFGVRWTIMDVGVGRMSARRQMRDISSFRERVIDVHVNYVNAMATFPIAKQKAWLSLGLQTIKSVYSMYLKYNNGERSFGKESQLSGNYKSLGLNSTIRLETFIFKSDKFNVGIYGQYTGAMAGTSGISIDNNAAKGALNLTNTVTSSDVKANFNGFILGINTHYHLNL